MTKDKKLNMAMGHFMKSMGFYNVQKLRELKLSRDDHIGHHTDTDHQQRKSLVPLNLKLDS